MSIGAVECVLKAEAIVGESPVWCDREGVLYWVDITGQRIHRFHPASGVNDTFHLPDPVTCVALRERGGLLATLRKDFAFFDPGAESLRVLDRVEEDKPDNRFNGGKCDLQGRFRPRRGVVISRAPKRRRPGADVSALTGRSTPPSTYALWKCHSCQEPNSHGCHRTGVRNRIRKTMAPSAARGRLNTRLDPLAATLGAGPAVQ